MDKETIVHLLQIARTAQAENIRSMRPAYQTSSGEIRRNIASMDYWNSVIDFLTKQLPDERIRIEYNNGKTVYFDNEGELEDYLHYTSGVLGDNLDVMPDGTIRIHDMKIGRIIRG